MASFKLRLVSSFVLLALLPLAAACVGFRSLTRSSETSRVDARLQAGLRATAAAYQDELAAAAAAATSLATSAGVRQALQQRDAFVLHALLRDAPDVEVQGPGALRLGEIPPFAALREAPVVAGGRVVGRVVVSLRLDSTFLARLQHRSGLQRDDRLVLVRDGIEIAGSDPGAPVVATAGRTTTVRVSGTRYRALVAGALREPAATSFAALSPQSAIDSATRSAVRRLLVGLGAALLLVALVAWAVGRAIVGRLGKLVGAARALAHGDLGVRVDVGGRDEFAELGRAFNEMATQLESRVAELEAERARLRDATARLGDALAATHDVDALLPVIVDTAIESTNASAGWIVVEGGETFAAGIPGPLDERIELPLRAGRHLFGTLVLSGPGFSVDEAEAASTFAGEAVIALENARLHRIVELQAASDGLTGLANRRHGEQALRAELARVGRFDGTVGLVLADLDNFKAVNDRHGHPTGDAVLREFAETVRASVRDLDTAARWGGEEFAVVLPGADADGAVELAERVRAALEERVVLAPDGSRIRITASFGAAAAPPAATEDELVAAADTALYEAKRNGKNCVVAASPLPQI